MTAGSRAVAPEPGPHGRNERARAQADPADIGQHAGRLHEHGRAARGRGGGAGLGTAGLYGGLSALPAFNPDHDGADLPPAAAGLRREIAAADAVMFCTPEYAGTLPGSFKNLLDWTVGGGELDGKPVAWLNVANQGRGGGAQATLETVLGYVGAKVVERPAAACRWPGTGSARPG